ncbi:hypothetical protein PGTUg99_026563 [Puccinia graminis f. sp. tritici]|uniref:Uncharacterized protein n=1 Tax=Puccinia graminis f. sp. tritici TaxID=56615 RepID=A0A5B0NHC5_PUCGR|nr:hypothetical protein PGTUg99_026563 [Puccinia graminis f. sp. tritici]
MLDSSSSPSNNEAASLNQPTQEDLVVEGFSPLIKKYVPSMISEFAEFLAQRAQVKVSQESPWVLSINLQDNLLHRLHSQLLPLLNNQINTLSLSLITSDLWKDLGKNIQLILQTQSQLKHTIDQIKPIITAVCRGTNSPESRMNDHHLQGLKHCRIDRLKQRFNEGIMDPISQISLQGQNLFKQIQLTPKDLNLKFGECVDYKEHLTVQVHRASEQIESTIQLIKGSELDLVQESWESDLGQIDMFISEIICAINLPTHLPKEGDHQTPSRLVHAPTIELARLSIPMVKLSKLFFAKLLKCGMNQRRFRSYSEMCLDQIGTVTQSIRFVAQELDTLISRLFCADLGHTDTATARRELIECTNSLKSRVESALLLVLLYYLPLVPDTEGFPVQSYYQNWFITWNTQFNLSIREFQVAVESFDNTTF